VYDLLPTSVDIAPHDKVGWGSSIRKHATTKVKISEEITRFAKFPLKGCYIFTASYKV